MKDFSKYFIVGTNSYALHDTMNGLVIGELIRCKDCKYWLPHSQFGFDEDNEEYYDYCELLVPDDDYYAITRQADDYCSRAERKEHETD